ncbi:MAG: hypothetical protein IPI03_02415 [Rubrivivax sp.]|nr:hypothetical protein [Rubrivivax sp.]
MQPAGCGFAGCGLLAEWACLRCRWRGNRPCVGAAPSVDHAERSVRQPATDVVCGLAVGRRPEESLRNDAHRVQTRQQPTARRRLDLRPDRQDRSWRHRQSKVYRQTLQQFFVKDQQIYSRVWRFNDPAIKQQGMPSPEFLQQVSPQQISLVMSEACLTKWTPLGDQFIGRIDPASCVIQSKYKNEKRRLFSEEIVFPSGVWFREGAYGEDGSLAFGLEEGRHVRLNRQRPNKP